MHKQWISAGVRQVVEQGSLTKPTTFARKNVLGAADDAHHLNALFRSSEVSAMADIS